MVRESFIHYVGQKIREYRLASGMSVSSLAAKINKSRKTVYNYECGLTAVDAGTLFDIAKVLEVSLFQLIDYQWQPEPAARLYPFGQYESIERLYMYHIQDDTMHLSIIRAVAPAAEGVSAILYYKTMRQNSFDHCDCVYVGYAYSEYTTLSFVMRNYFNRAENILINLSFRNPGNRETIGLISGLDVKTLEPVAFKVLVSLDELPEAEVMARLAVAPEEYRRIRTTGMLRAEDT